ncbi:tetratricopeptide repeat protein [Odoribacter sp. OttesenSCG-928-J03]|nr:tetratricopeptide repeat protein [Odoribacter sp. OttesenSCG-928-J03]
MKKIAILILTFFSLTVFGQNEIERVKKANELIADKKYESAFKLLDDFDPENNIPDIVLLKEDIVLNYFVTSIMHKMFALKDLEENENIMDYRGKGGLLGVQMFQVDSILERLIGIYPTNCKLYQGLGKFYYDTHLRYGERWLKSQDELFELMQTNFQKAVDGNCADYLSNYVLGYINLVQEKYQESIPHFLKSIEMNKDYATSYYNLAYAYFFIDDKENALKYVKNALDLYTDQEYKSDAARMLAQIYLELNDENNAIKNYELADKINPKQYYNLRPLLDLYVKTGNKKSDKVIKDFFDLAPTNPTIYNDLRSIYFNYDKADKLIAFYISQISALKNDKKVQGNLNFYLGQIYIEKDKKIAKEYFLKAKKIFIKVFDKNHQVFGAIEDGIKQCENQ